MTRRHQPSRNQGGSRIPASARREEEAAFWDTHDIADYQDELTTVRARLARDLSEGIIIRLDRETLAELRSRAKEQGIGPATLARMWILQHLKSPSP